MTKIQISKIPMRFRKSTWVLLILIIIVLAAIWVFSLFSHNDCLWYGNAKAWLDENRNGVWDSNEKALAGVEFHIDDTWNKLQKVGFKEAISDSQGESEISVWLPGCPTVRFEIYADPPSVYTFTTENRVPVPGNPYMNVGTDFSFGFVSED